MTDGDDEFYCARCSGKTTAVSQPYAVERDGKLVVVRDVPMHQCDKCGETYMTTTVMKQLDQIVADPPAGKAKETIVRYPAAA